MTDDLAAAFERVRNFIANTTMLHANPATGRLRHEAWAALDEIASGLHVRNCSCCDEFSGVPGEEECCWCSNGKEQHPRVDAEGDDGGCAALRERCLGVGR